MTRQGMELKRLLLNKIEKITKKIPDPIDENHSIAMRIMCPEYSLEVQDVKTFPITTEHPVYILFWNMEREGRLYATIKPSLTPFSFCSVFTDGEKTQLHTHDYIELAYVVKGEFRQRILGKDVRFQQGDLCLIDKSCLHQDYLFCQKSCVLFIGMDHAILEEGMVEKLGEPKIVKFLHDALMKQKDVQQFIHFKPKRDHDPRAEQLIEQLITELEANDIGTKYTCKGLLLRLLHLISTEYEFSLTDQQKKKMRWLIYEDIGDYIRTHYREITIRDLVDRFHFNEDYFNRVLKERSGKTYSEYVQDIRLAKAMELLTDTKMTVEQVAVSVGYQNKGYFYKIFTAKYHMTPAQARNKSRNR